jgi:enoyl-CoA hydratase/carnithine racemase
MTSNEALIVTEDDSRVRIALNRPERKNALDRALVRGLGDALEAAVRREATRVIVLTGLGGSFCSGADLASMGGEPGDFAARIDEFHRLIHIVVSAPQPVVAAVDGPAVGFGADLALACDLRVLSSRGYVQDSFVRIGLMPDGGGTLWLPELVGAGRALEFLFLGTRLEAERCRELGIANRVVPVEGFEAAVADLSRELSEAAPLAVRAIKAAVRASARESLEKALGREKAGQLALLVSEDLREGVGAFLGKRSPRFTGR